MTRWSRMGWLVTALIPSVAGARRPDVDSTVKVPTVEEVVRAEGFEPTPSQTELYRPGAVLVPNTRGGHDAVVADCIGVEPAVSIMSQSSIATILSAGVSTRLGMGTAAASAGVQKRLTFIDPEQRTLSLGVLAATDDCKQQLANAARFQDLSQAIVVHDVLVAIIQNTVCTRADAKGRVVALGEAEAAAFSECVQESDAQVPLGFKSVPLAKLVATTPAPRATASPAMPVSPGLDFGGTADLGVEARLKEQECAREAEAQGAAQRRARLSEAKRGVQAQATAAWRSLSSEATACAGLPRVERTACIQAVDRWLATAEAMPVTVPASIEAVETACGTREAAFPEESATVAATEVTAAKALRRKLQTAKDPTTAAVAVSGASAAPSGGSLDAQLARFEAATISVPPGKRSRRESDAALRDSLHAKAASLRDFEQAATDVIQTGAGEPGVHALVLLGAAYENMAASLRTSHVPTYLTADQAELYRRSLEDYAVPQEEKAVNAYQLALAKAFELQLYTADTRTAGDRLEALRPDQHPPLVEPLAHLTDPALAPAKEALEHRDYARAAELARTTKGADRLQTEVVQAVAARGLQDPSTAASIYRKQLKTDPGDRLLCGSAAMFYAHHKWDTKRARKTLQGFVDAHAGALSPTDEVFAWMEAVAQVEAGAKAARVHAQQASQQEAERRKRAEASLTELESKVKALRTLHQQHRSCAAFQAGGLGDTVGMVIEQAQMVIEAKEVDLVYDVLSYVDQTKDMARQAAEGCR